MPARKTMPRIGCPPGGSVSGFVVWRRRDWGEEVDGRGVDGRVAGANRRHRAANRVISGGCAAQPPRTCAAALTQTIRSYMVLHQMEYGNGWASGMRGLRSTGGLREQIAGTGRLIGWYREAVQLGRRACVLWRSPRPFGLTWSYIKWNTGMVQKQQW